jgi:hypothetical protein
MTFTAKPNTGALFKNDKKNDRQPDYQGDLDINGVAHRLVGWKKQGKSGVFLSLAVEPKTETKNENGRVPF